MDQAPPQPPARNIPLGWKQWLDELLEENKHMFVKLWSSRFFKLFLAALSVNVHIIANKDLHFLPFSDEFILQVAEIFFHGQLHFYCFFVMNYVKDLYRLQDVQAVAPPEPNQAQHCGGWRARIRGFFDVGLPLRKLLPIFPASLFVMFCAIGYYRTIQNLYKP